MAANIQDPEVAFPFGEDIKISDVTCTIKPDKESGRPTESGLITITFKYESATAESSDPTVKPLNRLFSVCNSKDDGEIFTRIISSTARFTTDPTRTPTIDGIGPKDLTLIIIAEGEKKNSMS